MAIISGGDGSAYAHLFSSKGRAERYMGEEPERFCDDIIDITHGMEIDPERYEWITFSTVVENFVLPDSGGCTYREDRILALAEHFECARSTVYGWAAGTIVPHESLREQVGEFIRRTAPRLSVWETQ